MYSCLLIDDHEIVGEGTKRLLEDTNDLEVDYVSSGAAALSLIGSKTFDLYIVDLNMPEMNGLELTQKITEKHSDAKILIYTGYDTTAYFNKLLEMGVVGFISKNYSNDQLIYAVMGALNDLSVIPRGWLSELTRTDYKVVLDNGKDVKLTVVEQDVLILVNQGASNEVIANEMHVSKRTVERHLTRIFQKFSVTSRADAIEEGKKLGVLPEFKM